MTRRLVYGFGLLLTVACAAMTIASVVTPRWVSYSPNDKREISMGLHYECSSIRGSCEPFPQPEQCHGDKKTFCHMWRTVGFLTTFAVAIQLATLVSFIVIIAGGVQRRTQGWKVICSVLTVGGLVQCAGMAIVAFLFDNDERFFEGWYLDVGFSLCTASWSLLILSAIGITLSALYLPEEGDYELIPDHPMSGEQDEQLQSRIAGWNDEGAPSRTPFPYQRKNLNPK
ncbi:hypothetical protein K491DRAFT_707905 [Lophiostoma macrostomum CBS 122681]|uniref:Uncharacterized protein n=1 Tax=Lophiostoma macrostomum CBS 122681 TaxID=1314788 RepID=A0A6A6SPP7_9PLEO|nr:hypothetical protein K491DRAFT_707905 [Lophiostoma macrostomum CBS 122681]